jgi:hypothetical protein
MRAWNSATPPSIEASGRRPRSPRTPIYRHGHWATEVCDFHLGPGRLQRSRAQHPPDQKFTPSTPSPASFGRHANAWAAVFLVSGIRGDDEAARALCPTANQVALTSNVGGKSMPSCRAVRMLMTSSHLAGRTTGKSARPPWVLEPPLDRPGVVALLASAGFINQGYYAAHGTRRGSTRIRSIGRYFPTASMCLGDAPGAEFRPSLSPYGDLGARRTRRQ